MLGNTLLFITSCINGAEFFKDKPRNYLLPAMFVSGIVFHHLCLRYSCLPSLSKVKFSPSLCWVQLPTIFVKGTVAHYLCQRYSCPLSLSKVQFPTIFVKGTVLPIFVKGTVAHYLCQRYCIPHRFHGYSCSPSLSSVQLFLIFLPGTAVPNLNLWYSSSQSLSRV